MMLDPPVQKTIDRTLRLGNHVRRGTERLLGERGHKEWLHFCALGTTVKVIVNLSWVDDVHDRATSETARVTLIAWDGEWDGDVDHFSPEQTDIVQGRLDVRLGESALSYRGGVLELRARSRKRPIVVDLVLRPLTIPTELRNIPVAGGDPIHWLLVPRLSASGTVRIAGREHILDGVPAYHDHNWGFFRWGQDFSWTWGFGHAASIPEPWALTFDRFSNRAQTRDFVRALLLWKGPRQHRIFARDEVEIRREGLLRPTRILKLPRVMALVRPEMATSVPERLNIEARGRGDHVLLELVARDMCQVIAPNDNGVGTTVINEVTADLLLDGTIRGERVQSTGQCMFELLGD